MIYEPAHLARGILAATRLAWRQNAGGGGEPMAAAWRRIFGEDMSVPVVFHHVVHEGRDVVFRLHPRGRVSVLDPSGGHQIRVRCRDARAEVLGNEIAKNWLAPRAARAALNWVVE